MEGELGQGFYLFHLQCSPLVGFLGTVQDDFQIAPATGLMDSTAQGIDPGFVGVIRRPRLRVQNVYLSDPSIHGLSPLTLFSALSTFA